MAVAPVLAMGRMDMHTHTTLSDGAVAPEDLVAQAQRLGLRLLAVADHDTAMSQSACESTAATAGIGYISAVEITSSNPRSGNPLHILGYGFLPERAESMESVLAAVRRARTDWHRHGVEKLQAEGYRVTWEEVLRHAAGGDVHRVHIMRALVDAGYTTRIKGDLYRKLSSPGASLAGDRASLDADLAIDLIHKSGGIAVLAHPGIAGAIDVCDLLVEMGLDGIEAFHPSHTPEIAEQALALAGVHRLAVTGGSDYHGIHSDYDICLGCPELTPEHVEDLLERIDAVGGVALSLGTLAGR